MFINLSKHTNKQKVKFRKGWFAWLENKDPMYKLRNKVHDLPFACKFTMLIYCITITVITNNVLSRVYRMC